MERKVFDVEIRRQLSRDSFSLQLTEDVCVLSAWRAWRANIHRRTWLVADYVVMLH